MPECWWYAKYGYCSAGDECLYAHPKERRVECPDYNRGFCKLGEYDASSQSTKYKAKSCNQDPNVRGNTYVAWYAKTTSPVSVLLVPNALVASKLSHLYACAYS